MPGPGPQISCETEGFSHGEIQHSFFTFFKFYPFIWKAEWDREILYLPISFPNAHNRKEKKISCCFLYFVYVLAPFAHPKQLWNRWKTITPKCKCLNVIKLLASCWIISLCLITSFLYGQPWRSASESSFLLCKRLSWLLCSSLGHYPQPPH